MKPVNAEKERTIQIVNQLLHRSSLSIDQVVARMQVDGCEITRSTFENRFTTRIHQKPNDCAILTDQILFNIADPAMFFEQWEAVCKFFLAFWRAEIAVFQDTHCLFSAVSQPLQRGIIDAAEVAIFIQ